MVPSPDDVERWGEVPLVRQAHRNEVGPFAVEHLSDVHIGPGAELLGSLGRAGRVASNDRAQVHVGPAGKDPRVMEAPPGPGADHRDP